MISNKNILIGLLLAILLIIGNWVLLGDGGKRKLPDVTFTTLTGDKINAADLKGHPTLITFWATDCPGCIAEMPHLIELYNELSGKGLKMVSIAMHYDPADRVIAMTKAKKLPYPVVLDTDGTLAKAFYNVQLTPTNFLVSPNGTIALQKIGEMDMNHVRTQILKMLDKG
jgi:peroxiredoxin